MPDQIFPEPTVGAFIFNTKGELLLLESHKWPGRYVVPGGHVELGERLEQALAREAQNDKWIQREREKWEKGDERGKEKGVRG